MMDKKPQENVPQDKVVENHEHVEVILEEDPEFMKTYLSTDPSKGLTDAEVQERLIKFGKNELPEVKRNKLLHFLSYFGGAISYLLEVACIISAIVLDWIDFGILLFVLIVSLFSITFSFSLSLFPFFVIFSCSIKKYQLNIFYKKNTFFIGQCLYWLL